MVRAQAALIESFAPGVVRGKGAFETMRAYGGKIFALEGHLNRLSRGLKFLGIPPPYPRKRLEQYLYRTIKANRLRNTGIRLAVWKEGRHLRTAIVCREAGFSDRKYRKGFKAVLSAIKRKKTRSSHIKSMDYSLLRAAFKEAQRRRCDEAILLNHRNELAEGSRTNIFFIKKGVLYTPAVRCGCLNGITRQIVIRCARRMGLPCEIAAADARELFRADEAFVTNALMGVMPLTVVEGRPVGRGRPGRLTRKLSRAYRESVHSACPSGGKSV